MAPDIHVTHREGDDYTVRVEGDGRTTEHRVAVTEEQRERYAPGASPEELLEASFRFLLEREPREAILSRFNLPVVEKYFPEFAAEIGERVGS